MVCSHVGEILTRLCAKGSVGGDVLTAYRDRCAVCVLRVRPLLDAAHVVPDREPTLKLVVNEGLALCATHHRAFDAEILRYDADYRVTIELPRGMRVGEI